MIFQDRGEAGQKLARELLTYKPDNPIIYALPRGGVAVAAEVARALDAPLELVLVRKIGVPWHPELAMGAVVDGETPIIVRNEDVLKMVRVSPDEFEGACKREFAEIERRRRRYLGDKKPLNPEGRVSIVIDDGIATGATVKAASRALRKRGAKKLIIAVPVASRRTIKELHSEADEILCLEIPDDLTAIGYFYRDFRQLKDDDVLRLLAGIDARTPAPSHDPGRFIGSSSDVS